MVNTLPVTLGGLELLGLEVPSHFDRVGRIRVAAHQVIGGGRTLQVTGFDPVRRQLAGTFVGGDAAERAQILEAMRDEAAPVLLTIGAWTELVLMTSLAVRYAERGSVVTYLVEAEAISDAQPPYVQTEEAVLTASIANLAYSSSLLSSSSIGSSAVLAVQTGLSIAGSLLTQSLVGETTTAIDLMNPGLALMNVISASGSNLVGLSTASSPDVVSDSAGLTAATTSAGVLATATCSGAYLNKASSQLASLNGSAYQPVVYS